MWRVFKESGRSWPELDDDPVIDYMIMEAVALKVAQENKEQQDESEHKEWKQDKEGLDRLRAHQTSN